MEEYGKRLNRASWHEFRRCWSGFLVIRTLSGLAAPIIPQVIRGVHSVLSLAELLESAGAGVTLSIIGTYLHSRRRGAESLDAALQNQVREHDAIILDNHKIIDALKKNPVQEHKENRVRDWLSELPDSQQQFIAWLVDHGEVEQPFASERSGIQLGDIVQKAYQWGLIESRTEIRQNRAVVMIRINPDYKDALYNVLHIHP